MSANVKISLDLPIDIQGTLFASEFEVLEEAGEDSLQIASEVWVGWKYGPNYPKEQRGTSAGSWKVNPMQPGAEGFTNGVQLLNDAQIQPRSGTYEVKAWGRPTGRTKSYANNQVGQFYAAYVTRSGSSRPEYEVIFRRMVDEVLPDTERRLRDRILENVGKKRKRGEFKADRPGTGSQFFEVI
jgi:hypothetical protein